MQTHHVFAEEHLPRKVNILLTNHAFCFQNDKSIPPSPKAKN